MPEATQKSLFEYLSYRSLLRDRLRAGGWTQAAFAARLDCTPALISQMITDSAARRRNLTEQRAEDVITALGFTPAEAEFFRALRDYTHAFEQGRPRLQRRAWLRMATFRRFAQARAVDLQHMELAERWYLPILLEMLRDDALSQDPEQLARRVIPAVSRSEVEDGLAYLLDQGFARRDKAGRLAPTDDLFDGIARSSTNVQQMALDLLYRFSLQHALDGLDRFDLPERYYGTAFVRIPEERMDEAKRRCIQLLRELVTLAEAEPRGRGRVFQLSLALFPRTD
ncbi:MAG: TIGR02147 family protein [Alphaproteobacteria bacterium]|nr:TIGR02147 family protein [Alphaproteobacteria bacterium]